MVLMNFVKNQFTFHNRCNAQAPAIAFNLSFHNVYHTLRANDNILTFDISAQRFVMKQM